jgi:anaerobic sulfite reductase subunit C
MKDVTPNPKCEIQGRIYWGGKRYDQNNELRNSMWRFSEREDAVVLKQGE